MRTITLFHPRSALILAAFAVALALAGGACGDAVPSDQTSSSGSTDASSSSSSSGGGGAGGGAPACTMNPMTHVEIINACTDAQQVDKMPVLPLLGKDGKLPPLP